MEEDLDREQRLVSGSSNREELRLILDMNTKMSFPTTELVLYGVVTSPSL